MIHKYIKKISHRLRQWHNHGEEVLANTLRILRGWGNTSDLRRRSRRRRRYCLNLEGWGGYSPIPPSHGYAIDIVLWGKINSSSWRVLINIPPSSRWVYIDQCTPLLPVGVHWSMYTHPDNSKIDFFSRRVYIGQCTPLLPKGVHWPMYTLREKKVILLLSWWVYIGEYPATRNTIIYFFH